MTRTRRTLASGAALVALVATAVVVIGFGGDGGSLAAGTLDLDGRALLVAADGEEATLETGRHRLADGDRLEVVDGSGLLGLDGEATLELRAGRDGAPDSEVELDEPVVLRSGDALLVAPTAARIKVGGTEYGLANGAAWLSRTTGSSVGVYAGEVGISSAGRNLPGGVPALRQATVAALGSVPTRAEPLDYDPVAPDPWDLRFIGAAIDLGEALEARSVGFTGALPNGTEVDADFLTEALPSLAAEGTFGDDLLDEGRAAGELLVGAAIAGAGTEGSFAERWDATFDFRGEGAQWGIVALDQGVRSLALLGAIDGAIDGATLQGGPADLALGARSTDQDAVAGSPDGPAGATTTTVPGSPPTTATPPTTAPPSDPGPSDEVIDAPDPVEPITDPLQPGLAPLQPVVQPLAPLLDPAGELLGGLLGNEDAAVPAPVTDPIVEPATDALGGVIGLLQVPPG